VSLNGVETIFDFSAPGVMAIYTDSDSFVWGSTGIHVYTADCSTEFDVLNADINSIASNATSSTPADLAKQSNKLSKRSQVSYIPYYLELDIGDSCDNPLTTLAVPPQFSIQQAFPDDPECLFIEQNTYAYFWGCYYYEGNAVCKQRAQKPIDGVCSEIPATINLYCSDIGLTKDWIHVENGILGAAAKYLLNNVLKAVVLPVAEFCTLF
jgi:hypothetical protein